MERMQNHAQEEMREKEEETVQEDGE